MLLQNYQEGDKRVQELERDYQLNQERLFDLLDQKGKEARKASLESIQKVIVNSMREYELSFNHKKLEGS